MSSSFVIIVIIVLLAYYFLHEEKKRPIGCFALISLLGLFLGILMLQKDGVLHTYGIGLTILFSLAALFFLLAFWGPQEMPQKKECEEETFTIPITFSVVTEEDEDEKPKLDPIASYHVMMTREQFGEIISCTSEINNLINRICAQKNVYDAVNENSKDGGGDVMPNRIFFGKVLKSIFVKDLKLCFTEMEHSFKFSTLSRDGQSIILITNILTDNKSNADLKNYDLFCKHVRSGKEEPFAPAKKSFTDFLTIVR